MSHPPLAGRPHPGRPKRVPAHLAEVSLGYALDDFLAALATELAPNTMASKRSITRMFEYLLGRDFPVWQLDRGLLRSAHAAMLAPQTDDETEWRVAEGLRPRKGRTSKEARAQVRSAIEQFVKHCHNNRWLDTNEYLAGQVTHGKKDQYGEELRPEKIRFKSEDWDTILDHAESIHMRCRIAVAIGLYCGRRVSETIRLKWGDISWDENEGMITFNNVKGGRPVKIPLFKEIRDELVTWHAWVTRYYGEVQPDWYVVPAKRNSTEVKGAGAKTRAMRQPQGWPLVMDRFAGTTSVTKENDKLLRVFGIGTNQGAGTHTWRRSRATDVANNHGMGAAQALLDHKQISTTQKYTDNLDGRSRLWRALMPGVTPPGGWDVRDLPAPIAEPAANHEDIATTRQYVANVVPISKGLRRKAS